MKKFCLCLIVGLILFSCGSSEKITGSKACIIAQEFVKEKLSYPETADFESLNYVWEPIAGSENCGKLYQKFTAKNGFGVPTEYIYKIEISYNGGEWTDESNWSYNYLMIEDINGGEQFNYNGKNVIDLTGVISNSIKILDYDCDIVKQTPNYIRICTPIKLTESEVREWLGTFDNDRFIYLCTSKKGPDSDYVWVADDNSHTLIRYDD